MKKSLFIYIFLFLFGGVMLAGCDDDDGDSLSVTGLGITPDSVPTLPLGESVQFTATATYSDGSTQDVTSLATWNTSNSAAVTIEPGGLAVTRDNGEADISAVYGVTSNTVAFMVVAEAPPPPSDPEDYNPDNVCSAEFCADDDALSNYCSTWLGLCLAAEPASEDECVGGALWICQHPDADPGLVCTTGACGADPALEQQCQQFMVACTAETASEEDCAGAMLFFCRPEE